MMRRIDCEMRKRRIAKHGRSNPLSRHREEHERQGPSSLRGALATKSIVIARSVSNEVHRHCEEREQRSPSSLRGMPEAIHSPVIARSASDEAIQHRFWIASGIPRNDERIECLCHPAA